MGKETVPEEKPVENGTEENEKEEDEKPTKNGHLDADSKEDEKEPKAEEDGEESDEEPDEEPGPGMLDKPVEILTTKRERKSTDFLVKNRETKAPQPGEDLDYTKGKGTAIKDIPYIVWRINKADTEDLYVLHKLMYKRNAKHNFVKRNIREFCGYPFGKEDKLYRSVLDLAWRLVLPGLRWINGVLGLEQSMDKNKMRDDLLEFLMTPRDTGMEVPTAKSPSAKSSAKKKKKSKSHKKKSEQKVKKTEDGSGSDVSEASDDSDGESEKEEKPAKSPKKKPTPKKKPAKATPVKIAVPMKKKSASKKRKSNDSDEDEEPLIKKKKGPPTDAELKEVVGSILKDADLEQVTMKNVVKQVYDQYSSFDLTSRKDYIKTCVKEIIS